ncbi:MAG: FHA domain-containing protein [Verrucomicrobia bacterium]|nr:FHA domain-containing protein [Verrucomicrobiota bacterium]MCG2679244.1 FHA domain-containing protein [Kiritimatiellia bacterium]MBU4248638.1 FHA domain-containing protein [Verrucomicrobiota bacterium]MBU4290099.1 FHA domain-containing protein [Verrucomicrobiota bacterium]MBU4429797.1 FHA domain-containing protein [Verrucomicrobiota bacterium]
MAEQPIHLIVEKGPDQRRGLTIPAEGARVGRSSNNDIVLMDPAMSRFHCRFFFKPGEGLWAEDLGSANQTLLNDKPLYESRLHNGDRLIMGDTTIKVVNVESVAQPVQNLFESIAGQLPAPGKIQFLRPPSGHPGDDRRRRFAFLLLGLLAVIAATVAVIWVPRLIKHPDASNPALLEPQREVLEIMYEKVQANSNNIFRYQMTCKNNELSIQIDDLKNRRHVPGNQMKKVDPELVQSLADSLRNTAFFDLKDEYKGLSVDVWDLWDLTLTIGRKARRVKVMNSLEPDAFKTMREAIEEFGQNELGLTALALSPEKLLTMARDAALLGQSLYDQRNVKNDNLALAIRSLKEAEWYLETIEPKPDFYTDAVALRGDSERELQDIYDNQLFLAERAIRLRDWAESAAQLRLICEKIPDRSDERHAAARKKLIDVERHLKKK